MVTKTQLLYVESTCINISSGPYTAFHFRPVFYATELTEEHGIIMFFFFPNFVGINISI